MLATKILIKTRFELKTSQKLWLTQVLYWKHNQLSYGIFSINLLLYFNVTHTIFLPKSWKDRLHIHTTPTPPKVYRRTSYISLMSAQPTRLRKDKLHIHSISYKLPIPTICPNHQVMEGHITYPPHMIMEGWVTYPNYLTLWH